MKNKYRNATQDIALGLAQAEYELEPTEARVMFWLQQGNYPQMCASIELYNGVGRYMGWESDSSPICYGNSKIEAIISLKRWITWRHPNVEVIISDYEEIKNCYPTYILEYCKYRRKKYWVGTWLPII